MLSPKLLQQFSFKVVAKVDQVETTEIKKPKVLPKNGDEEAKANVEETESQPLVHRAKRDKVGIYLLESGKCLV